MYRPVNLGFSKKVILSNYGRPMASPCALSPPPLESLIQSELGRFILYGESRQVLEQAGGCVSFRLVLLNALKRSTQAVECIVALPGHGGVGAGPFDVYLYLQPSLLADAQ